MHASVANTDRTHRKLIQNEVCKLARMGCCGWSQILGNWCVYIDSFPISVKIKWAEPSTSQLSRYNHKYRFVSPREDETSSFSFFTK